MKWLKVGAVIFGAVFITALGIDAADTLSGSRSTLLGQVIGGQAGACPAGMTEVPTAATFTCVDLYEASAGSECPHTEPANELQTREDLDDPSCAAASEPKRKAWSYVTREQAVTACMRAGKRLPQSDEWHMISVGTPDDAKRCNIDSTSAVPTGSKQECVSAVGAYDTIGNVWEWTSDDVIGGMYEGRELPNAGYVSQVDSGGVAVLTGTDPSDLFYKDYFWSSKEGAFGILRGGFYGSRLDAGIYAVHAETLPTAAGTAIGFRCVK